MPRKSSNEPISEITAQKYISLLRRKGAVIVEPEPIPIWTSSTSERSILYKAKEWIKKLDQAEKYDPPYFFLLNLGVDDSGEKHAIVVAFDIGEKSNAKKCHVHYFDPNGAISYDAGVKAPMGKGLRIFIKILSQVVLLLKEKYSCDDIGVIDDMEGIPNINTVGQGNCNALCLWYITNKFKYGCSVYDNLTELAIEMKRNDKKTIDRINTDIEKLKLLE
jgi:hypothetical protein